MLEVIGPPWARLVLLIALLQVAGGLAAAVVEPPPNQPAFLGIFFILFLLSFGGGAGLLLVGGRDDRRAVALGGFFLVVATAWASFPIRSLLEIKDREPLGALLALEPAMFIPYFFWRFVRESTPVPVSARHRWLVRRAVVASAWVGVVLFLLGLVAYLHRLQDPRPKLPRPLAWLLTINPHDEKGLVYTVIIPLALAGFAVLAWNARAASGAEHRRVRLFLASLCLLLVPLFALVLAFYVPPIGDYLVRHPDVQRAVFWAFFIPAWTAPCATLYAALVHHVLDLRLIARQALQYALARYSTIVLAAVPLVAIPVMIYMHRELKVEDLFWGRRVLLLVAAAGLGLAAFRYRSKLLEAIDRRFFREQYDARQILTLVLQRIRSTHEVGALVELLCRGIDQALHLDGIAVLVEDRRAGALVDPRSRARRLDSTSPLAHLVGGARDSLTVDLENPRSVVAGLPDADRHWLLDAGFRLIVPIVARDGSLLGLIGLGEKKSGLPFLGEDRKLLYDIADWAAMGLELELKHTSAPLPWQERRAPADPAPSDPAEIAVEQAKECANCGTLYLPYMVFCGTCSRKLEPALVPYVLPGKFRFERRIGTGGMGVVYRGVDLALGRPVAAKTLRRISPEDAMRLRREARTAASVSHPHLAAIYGVETWQGTPMLILELMEGGTLTQRMERGPLESLPAVELGIAMAAALERLHAADILHRDIKQSNIGFTRDGIPKLMDFGIARMMWDLRREGSNDGHDHDDDLLTPSPTSIWNDGPTSATASRQLVGTLPYLSPEALAGLPPNAAFDLWSLCLVLFECLLGRKLFAGTNAKQVMARIQLGRMPDLEQTHPGADPVLADFFRCALHRSLARRPATARELRARLESVRAHLLAKG